MKADPWYKTTLHLDALGARLQLGVPHDVFSTLRIDEGTLLLLEHLPSDEPKRILDMGCGYGALGLPLAAKFPQARVEMVDRDLLAVHWTQKNAEANRLSNVSAYGSLGFRNLSSENAGYDWILCNVPARIGRPFITHFLEAGRSRLTPAGDLRVVVIQDLVPLLEEISQERGWNLREVARGPRHVILSIGPNTAEAPQAEPQDLYLRDTIEISGLSFERPYDLGGDDPQRVARGLPVLLDALPRQAPRRVLTFRSGYGVLPLVARKRWNEASITAVDRDLLATDFTRRNAERLGLGGEKLSVREVADFPEYLRSLPLGDRFDLAVGELSPSAGDQVAVSELKALQAALTPQGQVLFLILDKIARGWITPLKEQGKMPLGPLIARDGYTVFRLTPA